MVDVIEFQTPSIPQGWGGQYPLSPLPVISGFSYDLPNQILYTIYPKQQYDVFLTVPTSMAQQLTLAGKQNSSQAGYPNQDTIYTQQIARVFPQCLLTEDGLALLAETTGNYLVLT